MSIATVSDEEFLAACLSCRLPAAQFDHQGHVRFAWLLLRRHPLEVAIEAVCDGIVKFAAHQGAADKFHRTVSEALVRLMAHGGAATLSWDEFLRANPQLITDVKGTLARYYSAERLSGTDARTTFIAPDLLPLPACHT